MTRVINVSTICFELIFLKKTFEERRFEETGELDGNDDDDADERERDTWREGERRRLRLLLAAAATSTLTQSWRRVEAAIGSDDSSE